MYSMDSMFANHSNLHMEAHMVSWPSASVGSCICTSREPLYSAIGGRMVNKAARR